MRPIFNRYLCNSQSNHTNVFLSLVNLDAMIVLGMILLTEAGQQSDQRKGRLMAIAGLVLVAIFFSVILSVFRSKAQGYPYR